MAADTRVDPAVFATAETLRPGAFVMAVGNPLGFTGALSTGVVHAVGGEWIQAAVRLAPGNSGGPLANAHGQVVGINTMAAQNGRLALAIPSDAALSFLQRPQGMRLGITVVEAPAGLVITALEPGSPAARASLLIGDVLSTYRTPSALRRAIEHSAETGKLRLDFQRGGKPNNRSVWITTV
jgi:serine protease Do